LDELFVEHDDDLQLSLADNSASEAEGNVSTLYGANADDSVANAELVSRILGEHARPEGESLCEEELRVDEFLCASCKVHLVEVIFDVDPLIVDRGDHRSLQSVEAHVYEWQRRNGKTLDPPADLLYTTYSVGVLSAEHIFDSRHLVLLADSECVVKHLRELLFVLSQNVHEVNGVLPMRADVPVGPRVLIVGKLVNLVDSQVLLVLSESHEARNVLLLGPRFDVKADVDKDSILCLWALILDHEGARHCSCDATGHFKHLIDFLLTKVGL